MTDSGKPRSRGVRIVLLLLSFLKWTAIVVVALLLLVRAMLPFVAPYAAKKVGEKVGFEVALDDLTLSVLAGDLELSGIEVRPLPDQGMTPLEPGEPTFALDRLAVDVSMKDLLHGIVRVRSVDVEGLHASVERRKDGSLVLPNALQDQLDAPSQEEPKAEEPDEPAKPFDFSIPVIIDRVTLAHLQLHARDHSVEPALDRRLDLDLRVTDVGLKDKPFRVELRATAPKLLESLRVVVDGALAGPTAKIGVGIDIAGVGLDSLGPYLAGSGIEPLASRLDLGMRIDAALDATNRPPKELGATVSLSGLSLRADLEESLGLDKFEIKVDRLSDAAIDVGNVVLAGLRAAAEREADGKLRVAGLRIDPNAQPPASAPSTAKKASPPPVAESASKPPPVVRVGSVRFDDLKFAFKDAMQSPPIAITPTLVFLATHDLVLDAKPAEHPLAVSLALALPGYLDRIELDAKSAVNPGDTRSFALDLAATGIHAVELKPWLDKTGIEPTIVNGELALHTSGNLSPALGAPKRIDAKLTGVTLKDGAELFGLDGVVVDGVSLASDKIEIAGVSIENPRAFVKIGKDGTLIAPGVKIAPKPAAAESSAPSVAKSEAAPPNPAPGPSGEAPAPEIVLQKLSWKNSKLGFEDGSVEPAHTFILKDVDLAVGRVHAGGKGLLEPLKLHLGASVDGLLNSLILDLEATATTAGSDLDAAATLGINLSGVDVAGLEPYLRGTGIAPQFPAADLSLKLIALANKTGDTTRAGVNLSEVRLGNGTNSLFALDQLAVREADLGKDSITVDAVEVHGLRLAAQRLADGGLVACGVALVPPPASSAAPSRPGQAKAETPAAKADAKSAPPAIRLHHLVVDEVRLGWKDDAVAPPVATELTARLGLEDLALIETPTDARFSVEIGLDGALERLGLDGTVTPNPNDLRLAANLAINGLRPDSVAGYLTSAPKITLRDGRLKAAIEAHLAKAAEGGQDAALAVRSFEYRDGEQLPFVAFDAFEVAAPRIDAEKSNFHVSKLTLAGLSVSAEKEKTGELRLLGIELPNGEGKEIAKAAAKAPLTPDAPPAESAKEAVPPNAAAPIQKALSIFAQVDSLDLDLAHASFRDLSKTDPPFEAAMRLTSAGPIVIDTNERTTAAPPIELVFTGHADPIGSDVAMKIHAEPLAAEPSFGADFRISKIDAEKLAALVPGVFDTSEPPRIRDGVFSGAFDGRLVFRRRGALDFDVSRGFGAVFQMKDIAFRDKPDGEVLAGLDGFRVSVKRMAPQTGEMHVEQIEVNTPRLSVVKRAAYTEVAGMRFPNPPPAPPALTADPSAAPAPASASPAVAEKASEVAAAKTLKPEMRVDEIVVHGIAVNVRDETSTPPFVLPLDKLEVDIRNLTTRALEQPVPVRFDIQLGAGKVDLEKRKPPESLVGGIGDLTGDATKLGENALKGGLEAGGAAVDVGKKGVEEIGNLVSGGLGSLGIGKKKEPEKAAETAAAESNVEKPVAPVAPVAKDEPPPTEQRPLFEEIDIKGQLALVPSPKGNVDVRISGFELLGLKGPASQAGVTISDGLLDLLVQTKLLGADGLQINTVTSLDSLSMTEPKDGPISRYLQLPAPLDVVIFALRDEEGVLRIPLRVGLKPDDISITSLLGAVTRTLGEVIGRAIAHSALRAVGTVGDISGAAIGAVGLDKMGLDKPLSAIGIGGGKEAEPTGPVTIEFDVAASQIPKAAREQIATLVKALSADPESKVVLRHMLASSDVELAATRVNPDRRTIDDLIARLRHDRVQLQNRCFEKRAILQNELLNGDAARWREDSEILQATQEELGKVEENLDSLYDLTAPDAERRKSTRARVESILVAMDRLREVKSAIVSALGPEAASRVETQAPRFLIEPSASQAKGLGGAVVAEIRHVRANE